MIKIHRVKIISKSFNQNYTAIVVNEQELEPLLTDMEALGLLYYKFYERHFPILLKYFKQHLTS